MTELKRKLAMPTTTTINWDEEFDIKPSEKKEENTT